MPTIAETLRETRSKLLAIGIPADEASIEARVIIQHVTRRSHSALLTNSDDQFPDKCTPNLNDTISRRQNREPLAYILGTKDFYNRSFRITGDVLIPRPETEHLIDITIEFIHQYHLHNPSIYDIGTGSGIIAITLAKEIPNAEIDAIDVSSEAIALAKANAQILNAKINFTVRDVTRHRPGKSFDVIVSNPPYIKTANLQTLQPEVRDWEPRQALDGGPSGMKIVALLIQSLPFLFKKAPAAAFIEIDPPIVDACQTVARQTLPNADIQIHRDYAGLERVLAVIID